MRVLMLAADGFEDLELLVPYYRFKEEGMEVDIASMDTGVIKGKRGYTAEANKSFNDVEPSSYDLLLLPGGRAPAAVRKESEAVTIAKAFFRENKPVAAICHGPQLLVTAGLLQGRHLTSYRSVADEVRDAGGVYHDEAVVVDGNLITSRQPSDLPDFMREILKVLKRQS